MSLSWVTHRYGGGRCLEGANAQGWRVVACLPELEGGQTHYLMPVRLLESPVRAWEAESAGTLAAVERQTDGLGVKLRAIDRLALSPLVFHQHFVASRMVIWVPDTADDDEVWDFARSALGELRSMVGPRLVTQIDYDQKRMHATLGSILDNIDFAVKHDPSALATVIAFELVLDAWGSPLDASRVTVTGVGDLGSRIVRLLLEAGTVTVFVRDANRERLERCAAHDRVAVCHDDDLPHLRCAAHILSADHSYSDELAQLWASHSEVVAVGGPEAGLDRFVEARRTLTQHSKQFIPSVLCGSLGLVCNLEESLEVVPDLAAITERYRTLVERLIAYCRGSGVPFADGVEKFLTGELENRGVEAQTR